MTTDADRRMVDAITDGDWTRCGACGTRLAVGIVAVKEGARARCTRADCRTWNRLRIEQVRE